MRFLYLSHNNNIGSFYYSDPETSSMIAKIDDLSATFHFHPAVNNIENNKKMFASTYDLTQVPSNAQYWGAYTGFNNRPRKAEGFIELSFKPVCTMMIMDDDLDGDDDDDDDVNDDEMMMIRDEYYDNNNV